MTLYRDGAPGKMIAGYDPARAPDAALPMDGRGYPASKWPGAGMEGKEDWAADGCRANCQIKT